MVLCTLPQFVIFTAANWSVVQPVRLNAPEDFVDQHDRRLRVSHGCVGATDEVTKTKVCNEGDNPWVLVDVKDNDEAGITMESSLPICLTEFFTARSTTHSFGTKKN